ncbi:MAG TPA: dienelactone hydrolase family protein, partial [Candidatus Caenarcaniphilales bacterium]
LLMKRRKYLVILTISLVMALVGSLNSSAQLNPQPFQLHTEVVEYRHGNTLLEGYLAYNNAVKGKRPGVLVVHEWTGLGPYVRRRTEQLAKMGYVAFAIDMYGKGVRPKDSKEAASQAQIYRSNRLLMRSRANTGLAQLQKHQLADINRIAAIGYCFGGGTVLELARSGADIAGVVSFHGNLDTPNFSDARNIKGKVLVLHGADDPLVPAAQVLAFQDEMRQAGVDWQLINYGGTVHSFTNPESGNDLAKGIAYNSQVDKRSLAAMKLFFAEILD